MRNKRKKRISIFIILLSFTVLLPFLETAADEISDTRTVTLTVICEDIMEGPARFVLTGDDGVYEFYVSEGDGYRITERIPFGNYSAEASFPEMEEDSYEIFVDGTKEADTNGTYHFYALAGSWLYTVQNAGLVGKDAIDENGDPRHYGIIDSNDALSYMQEAEDTSDTESYIAYQEEEGPEELEDQSSAGETAGEVILEPQAEPVHESEGEKKEKVPALLSVIFGAMFIIIIAGGIVYKKGLGKSK